VRRIAILAAVLWIGSTAPVAADDAPSHRPVSGRVEAVDVSARTVTLGGEDYLVPSGTFDLGKLEKGEIVVLYWELRGNRKVVLEVEHHPAGG
jgi:hypothetical protein